MYFNRQNILWVIFLGFLFFTSYGSVNHLTYFIDKILPVGHYVFGFEKAIPFIPAFIYPYMSIDFFYGLAFFIVSKNQYSTHIYKKIINSLGIQLLINQLFSLLCFLTFPLRFTFDKPNLPQGVEGSLFTHLLQFDLPYNQTPSLHISILVILWVFYNQHLRQKWLKALLHIWFFLIGASVLFTYQHHFIDLVMGLYLGMALVLMFNYDPNVKASFHENDMTRVAPVFKKYLWGIIISFVAIFILPIVANLTCHQFHIPTTLHFVLWFAWVSLFMIFKIMFYGNHYAIRSEDHSFTWMFLIIGFIYLKARKTVIRFTNYYNTPVQITHQLYATNLFAIKKAKLDDNSRVINLAWEADNHQGKTVGFPMVDLVIPNYLQISLITAKMDEFIKEGKTVYVHCALGVFRTIFVVGSYLIRYEHKTPLEVYAHLMSLPLDKRVKNYVASKKEAFLKLFQNMA